MMAVVVVVVVVVGVKPMQCTSGKGGARELKISEARVPGVVGGKGFFRSVADRPRTCRARGGETSNHPLAAAVLLPPSQISTPVRRRVSSRSTGPGSFLFFGLLFFYPLAPPSFASGVRFFFVAFFFSADKL